MPVYSLPESDEALLGECDVTTFRAHGPGGQHVNTTDSAVRLKHRPSGVVVTCRRERSQHLNKTICLRRLREKVAALEYEPPLRVPTKPSAAAARRRLQEKRRRARLKQERAAPTPEE
jgi:protein subunit release factor B